MLHLAGAYSPDGAKSEIPSITSALRSSKGYAGEWISEDLREHLEDAMPNTIVRYRDAADSASVRTASVILVQADSLQAMDKKIKVVLEELKDKAYKAILTGGSR